MTYRVINQDAIAGMRSLPDQSVNCCITSPPYFGLRDYGVDRQLGLEKTPDEYVSRLVEVFREVRRVLSDDGTLWLNLGDSYAGGEGVPAGLKPKDLIGIPWMVAFALRADGYYLRQDIIWSKPNSMPESVKDRCTKAHEHLFLLAKSERYYYDADAIAEKAVRGHAGSHFDIGKTAVHQAERSSSNDRIDDGTRNKRSVWAIATKPYAGAHFAVMPEDLVEPCVLAGCPDGGTVLDPFTGSGTVGVVALRHGRNFIGTELNPEYVQMARYRIMDDCPLLNQEAA